MDIPAWLILLVAVLLWACYYYRYGYLELKRKTGKTERETKQEDNILLGTPIEPKHANPKLKHWGITKSLRRFFADFDQFGVITNEWAPIKDSPWRLQELENTRLRTFNDDSPKYGRRYDLFYNQQRVGSLEIADTPDYTTEEPRVRSNVVILDARVIPHPLDDVSRFLTSIATLLSAGTGDEYAEAKRNVEVALTQAYLARRTKGMDTATEVVTGVSFVGSAATYIKLRERQDKDHQAA
jgi:hypothetical protein